VLWAAIEARVRELPAPPWDIDPWTAETHLTNLDLRHHTCDSVRHKAASAVRYSGKAVQARHAPPVEEAALP
jgi:hypothetical protein